jgi:hypothetical protein
MAINDYPHVMTVIGADASLVEDVVRARYAAGPFVSVPNVAGAKRRVIVARRDGTPGVLLWESHGGLTPAPSLMVATLRERAPGVVVDETNQMWPGEPPHGAEVVLELGFELDAGRVRAAYEAGYEKLKAVVAAAFPLERSDASLRMELVDVRISEEEPRYGVWKPRKLVECAGNAVIDVAFRSGATFVEDRGISLLTFPALAPDGTYVWNGHAARHAPDDVWQQMFNLVDRVRDALSFGIERVEPRALTSSPWRDLLAAAASAD